MSLLRKFLVQVAKRNEKNVLSRNPKAIKNYSKIIQWIKSRNCDVIGDFTKITLSTFKSVGFSKPEIFLELF